MASVRETETPGVYRIELKKTIHDPDDPDADEDGKVQRRWSLTVHAPGKKGRELAERVKLRAQAHVDAGEDPVIANSEGLRVVPEGTTVARWANEWLEAQNYEPSWAAKVQRILAGHILPRFGRQDVDEVSHIAVQGWLTGLSTKKSARTGEKLKPKTVNNIWGVFAPMMAAAVAEGLRDRDPCAGLKPPKVSKRRRRVVMPTPLEVFALADAMLIRPDGDPPRRVAYRWRLLTLFLAFNGWRWEEAAGLRRPGELHLLARPPYASVVEPVKTTGRRGGRYHGDPKSAAGERDTQMIQPLADELAAFLAGHGHPYVFGTSRGTPHHYQDYQAAFASAAAAVGRPELEIHDLRRFHATLLRHCARAAVQERLGHEPKDVTDVYTGVEASDRAEILRVLLAAWREGCGEGLAAGAG